MRAMLMSAVLIVLGGAAMADAGFDLRLARDGESRVTVVVPEGAGKLTVQAAADLQRCLGMVLGVEVGSVVKLSQVKTPLSILVGDAFGVDFGVDPDVLPRDGCALKTRGGAVLITGPHDAGIANGVYTFLTDCVGVRWFGPGDLYEQIPAQEDLTLPEVDYACSPDFSYRLFSGVVGERGSDWMRRNRLDTTRDELPYYGFGHNLANIISPEVYAEDHPEYFALVDGKRCIEGSGLASGAQPCFTNPDVIRIAAEAADRYFRENPQYTTFSLCVNDNALFCQCAECRALDEPVRKSKSGWDTYSDSYFHFVREVADIVSRTNPGKYLGCYAYWGVEPVPRSASPLPDNVVIALTQDTSQHFDPEYRKADRDLWMQWSKVAARLGKYDYYGLGWLTPRYFPALAADDLKFLGSNYCAGLYCEVYPNWSVSGPQLYMAARLLWDVSLDPKRLLDEYYNSLFGAAAPEMRRFYELLEKYWTRPRAGRWFQGLDDIRPELQIVDAKLIDEAWQCLFRAKPLAIGREVERVTDVEDHFRFTYRVVKGYALSRELAEWDITGREDLARLISGTLKTLEIIRLARKDHDEVWMANPSYRFSYFSGDRFERKYDGWTEQVALGLREAVRKVSTYCEDKLPPDEGRTVWDDLRGRLLDDPSARELKIVEQTTVIQDDQTIVFLGDSITEAAGGYVSVVEQMLGALVPGTRVRCINAGISGHKVTDMLARVDSDVIAHNPDWVTVSVGINDVWHGEQGVPIDVFREKYAEMVSRLKERTSARLALFTTTVIQEDLNSENNRKLEPYNEFIRETARRENVLLVEMNQTFHQAIRDWQTVGEGLRFTTDGVHMTPKGDSLMAITLLRAWNLL